MTQVNKRFTTRFQIIIVISIQSVIKYNEKDWILSVVLLQNRVKKNGKGGGLQKGFNW